MEYLATLTNGIKLHYHRLMVVASSPEIAENFGCDTIPTPYMADNAEHAMQVVKANYPAHVIAEFANR